MWSEELVKGDLRGNPRLLHAPFLLMILCLESGRGGRFQPLSRDREWACSLSLRFNSILFIVHVDSWVHVLSKERGHRGKE